MRKLIAGATTLATIAVVSGCTSLPPPEPVVDMTMARQNVKIYEVTPPFSTPIDQITAAACDGTREDATDRLLAITFQRGGNGLVGLACRNAGLLFFLLVVVNMHSDRDQGRPASASAAPTAAAAAAYQAQAQAKT